MKIWYKLNYSFISFTDATSLRGSHFFPSLSLLSLHGGGTMANSESITAMHRRKHVIFIVIMVYHNAYFKMSYHVSHKRCSWGHKLAVLLLGWIIYFKMEKPSEARQKFLYFILHLHPPVLWQGGARIFFLSHLVLGYFFYGSHGLKCFFRKKHTPPTY